MGAFDAAFGLVLEAALATGLPEIEEGTWYGTPALKVRGKGFTRLKDPETLVVLFKTDHYKGWPAILVRLSRADVGRLSVRLEQAWRMKAPKALTASHDARRSAP